MFWCILTIYYLFWWSNMKISTINTLYHAWIFVLYISHLSCLTPRLISAKCSLQPSHLHFLEFWWFFQSLASPDVFFAFNLQHVRMKLAQQRQSQSKLKWSMYPSTKYPYIVSVRMFVCVWAWKKQTISTVSVSNRDKVFVFKILIFSVSFLHH